MTDLGPARPVGHGARHPVQRPAQFRIREGVGDAGERGTEDKSLNAGDRVLQGEDELYEEPAVEIHGAADITKQDDLRLLDAAGPPQQFHDLPAAPPAVAS